MISFKAILQQFGEKGEKTGWTYIEIPAELAEKLNPATKKAFRVKGQLDKYTFESVGLIPMGEGNFILAVNATMRKGIKKRKGASVEVTMQVDTYQKPLNLDFIDCLKDEPDALKMFKTLTPSHQRYFSAWIESAKTDATKTKRITQSVIALSMGLGYSEMIRSNKKF
jgi:uncharacterized protein YdeI (YjbR/CyaY-like superfamily)